MAETIVAIRAPLTAARKNESQVIDASFPDAEESRAQVQQAIATAAAELEQARQQAAEAARQEQAAAARAHAEASAAATARLAVARQWPNRFAACSLKPIPPEGMAWNVMQALGVVGPQRAAAEAELLKKDPHKPPASDAAASARWAARVEWETYLKLKGPIQRFVALFGSGSGQPERGFFATVDQALFFANGGEVQSWLAPASGNLSDRLLKTSDAKQLADELYLSVLTRRPSADESAEIVRYLAARTKDRPAAVQEMVWALVTSSEFRFNH
jgi:hypothetical protein